MFTQKHNFDGHESFKNLTVLQTTPPTHTLYQVLPTSA